MDIYKLLVNDRGYTSWSIVDSLHFKQVDKCIIIDPIQSKLFTNDFFKMVTVNGVEKAEMVHSSIRSGGSLPGVLILHGNKTYGRKRGKLLYKCIPDDMRVPPFLVPYEIKHIGFSKVINNLYVTFSYSDWDEKHPHGLLNLVIGPVDILDNFYEYQLYCKSLNASIQKFQKETTKVLQSSSHEELIQTIRTKYPSIADRTNQSDWHILTIDPNKSLDFDDAFSIKNLEDGVQQLSIYISNVTIWMDVLNLWDSFSRRISTIYLPDRKRPMLPTVLSDCLCSLQANNTRIALVMDIFFKNDECIKINYSNCFIKVFKNYVYEEPALLQNEHYLSIMTCVKKCSLKYKYMAHVRDSHDMVAYLMIFMNFHCAKNMIENKNGVFRSTIIQKKIELPDSIPEGVTKFIKIWNSGACGQYINGVELEQNIEVRHELLELDAYIHITSPIRRLVDLLNIIQLQENKKIITLSKNATQFYKKWIDDLEYINVTMRSIRKVQIDCSLLDLCYNNPEVLTKKYDGYVFDKIERNDGLFQYMVFLPDLKLASRIVSRENFQNYDNQKFVLYLFQDEENFKKKIRLHLVL